MKTMRAMRIHTYGNQEVLRYDEITIPSINADELLIRVHHAAVNPVDWKIREGYLAQVLSHDLPLTLGWDFSGDVVALGKNVTTFTIGDAVFGHPSMLRNGAYAEYIAVRAAEVAHKPKTLTYAQAAAIPLGALTAWQALFDIAQLTAGQSILIHAAAGGVGHLAVQLAKYKGAYVLGTGSEKNKTFLAECGVDEFINYQQENYLQHISQPVDVLFDLVGGETLLKSLPLVKSKGYAISVCDTQVATMAAKYRVQGKYFMLTPNGAQLTTIAQLIDAGKIKPYVNKIFPLPEARKAQQLSQAGHTRGKIVLEI